MTNPPIYREQGVLFYVWSMLVRRLDLVIEAARDDKRSDHRNANSTMSYVAMVAKLLEPHCGDGMAEPITIDECLEQVCADLTIALGIRPDTGGLVREALSHVCPGLCMPSNLVAKSLLIYV